MDRRFEAEVVEGLEQAVRDRLGVTRGVRHDGGDDLPLQQALLGSGAGRQFELGVACDCRAEQASPGGAQVVGGMRLGRDEWRPLGSRQAEWR